MLTHSVRERTREREITYTNTTDTDYCINESVKALHSTSSLMRKYGSKIK